MIHSRGIKVLICIPQTEDDRPTFRPFTRESLARIEARIQEYNAKTKDLERKRAEGEVGKQL